MQQCPKTDLQVNSDTCIELHLCDGIKVATVLLLNHALSLVVFLAQYIMHICINLYLQQSGSDTTKYTWDWGDSSSNSVVVGYATSRTQSHMYTTPGNYYITVTVSDGSGASVEKPILVLGTANLCIG